MQFNMELARGELSAVEAREEGSGFVFENSYVFVVMDKSGAITSFLDKRVRPPREVRGAGLEHHSCLVLSRIRLKRC
jgi:hypothetical protein